jgi:hypothetical protein
MIEMSSRASLDVMRSSSTMTSRIVARLSPAWLIVATAILAWLGATGTISVADGVAAVTVALAGLAVWHVTAARIPAPLAVLVATRHHDQVRRVTVVRLADPNSPGRPRPRAPDHPLAH